MQTTLNQLYAVDQIGFPVLTCLIFLPLIGALAVFIFPKWIRQISLGTTIFTFLLALSLIPGFVPQVSDMQFVERVAWVAPLGIDYHLGVDGISLLLILLTAFLSVLVVLFSLKTVDYHLQGFLLCLLGLEVTLIGVFAALDLILFFLFWEVMLLPMYFLIKVWGGEGRDRAALKFVLYTLVGSVLMLVGFAILYLNYHDVAVSQNLPRQYSFSLIDLLTASVPPKTQALVFLLLFFGFAFKVPMVPFHTWLPDAHVEAPTAGSVMLAGVLLKMGVYGFVRFSLPLLPEASYAFMPMVSLLAVIGILYGAFLALAQDDIKKLIAYSSISHLGFVILGIFAFNDQGMRGGLLQMLNHGISTSALFFVVGFLYVRRHTRLIAAFGGLYKTLPLMAFFFLIASLASMGMPGTNGFVGEFLILVGAAKANWVYGGLAVGGVVVGSAYMLWLYQRVMVEPTDHPENRGLTDLNVSELVVSVALMIMVVWPGLYPQPFLRMMEGPVQFLMARTERVRVDHEGAFLTARLPASKGPSVSVGPVMNGDSGGKF